MKTKQFNILGAAILIAAAGILALTGTPSGVTPLVAADEVGQIALSGEDKIDPVVVGEWVIEEKKDFLIIDLRSPFEFTDFNIPGSLNIPFASLMTKDGLDMLPGYKKIVLAAADEVRAGQAWVVLRSKGFDAYILDGGIKGWWDSVMTPGTVKKTDDEYNPAEYAAKLRVMREQFSGAGSSLTTSSAPVQSSAPPPPPPAAGGAKKKKKAGGC